MEKNEFGCIDRSVKLTSPSPTILSSRYKCNRKPSLYEVAQSQSGSAEVGGATSGILPPRSFKQ